MVHLGMEDNVAAPTNDSNDIQNDGVKSGGVFLIANFWIFATYLRFSRCFSRRKSTESTVHHSGRTALHTTRMGQVRNGTGPVGSGKSRITSKNLKFSLNVAFKCLNFKLPN